MSGEQLDRILTNRYFLYCAAKSLKGKVPYNVMINILPERKCTDKNCFAWLKAKVLNILCSKNID